MNVSAMEDQTPIIVAIALRGMPDLGASRSARRAFSRYISKGVPQVSKIYTLGFC